MDEHTSVQRPICYTYRSNSKQRKFQFKAMYSQQHYALACQNSIKRKEKIHFDFSCPWILLHLLPPTHSLHRWPGGKASTSRATDLGSILEFDSRFHCGSLSRSSHTSDFKMSTPVASLLSTWHYRVSAGTGWPSVCILWLSEKASLICNFYLSVAAYIQLSE